MNFGSLFSRLNISRESSDTILRKVNRNLIGLQSQGGGLSVLSLQGALLLSKTKVGI